VLFTAPVPRTGELAKGSVAAQAKARFTLETDEVHKPVDIHALRAAISKHLHLLAGNKRAVQTAACESPRSVTTGRDALVVALVHYFGRR
jgi:hypothetical protein